LSDNSYQKNHLTTKLNLKFRNYKENFKKLSFADHIISLDQKTKPGIDRSVSLVCFYFIILLSGLFEANCNGQTNFNRIREIGQEEIGQTEPHSPRKERLNFDCQRFVDLAGDLRSRDHDEVKVGVAVTAGRKNELAGGCVGGPRNKDRNQAADEQKTVKIFLSFDSIDRSHFGKNTEWTDATSN
jgi:hypothetical protein